ncbi:uncharacterized protein ACRADG_003870 [Cochliomyia hominivorax]
MQIVKYVFSEFFIGTLSMLIYAIAFLNIITTFICKIISETENVELQIDSRQETYFNIYRVLLIIFSFVMFIISINLIKGILKKSLTPIVTWLVMSLPVIVYHILFLLDQAVYYFSFGYIVYSISVIMGLSLLLGLHFLSYRKILYFSLDLYQTEILQNEEIVFIRNSVLRTQNYHRNLRQNDSSILMPLNEEDIKKQYSNCNSENLNKFDI